MRIARHAAHLFTPTSPHAPSGWPAVAVNGDCREPLSTLSCGDSWTPRGLALKCDADCDSGRLRTLGHSHSLNSALGASECHWSGVVAIDRRVGRASLIPDKRGKGSKYTCMDHLLENGFPLGTESRMTGSKPIINTSGSHFWTPPRGVVPFVYKTPPRGLMRASQ